MVIMNDALGMYDDFSNVVSNEQSISVSYNLPTDAPVTCMLYDSAGKYITTFSGSSSAALARITLPSGVYHLRLIQSGQCVATAKLIIP